MEIQKQNGQAGELGGAPGEEDLALIGRCARARLQAEEVYVFRVRLCDNEIDRDGERFPLASLQKLAELFPGKTGLFDHSGKAGDQVMRVYAARVEIDPERTNSLGEPYAQLTARVYLPRAGNEALIRDIDAGIKKEASISCAVAMMRCSVCGEAYGSCGHKKGGDYGGQPCHVLLEEPTDAYEFSFVAVPAQPAAGVLKKKQESRGQENHALKALAEDGLRYRAELLQKAVRAGGLALPGLRRDLMRQLLEPLDAQNLREIGGLLEAQAAKSLPLQPQLLGGGPQGQGNEGFKI